MEEDRGGQIFAWIFVICAAVAILAAISMPFVEVTTTGVERREPWADTVAKPCKQDCEGMGLEYLRYDTSGFGSNECWCEDDGGSIQIW